MTTDNGARGPAPAPQNQDREIVDWADLGQEMWSYLTGRGAAINYSFVDMTVEVPRDTGPQAPRATWKLNGTLRVTTADQENQPVGQA
ncbi:MAG TPA: hypothetical protein VFQ19_15235 [Nocardioidaceae bacterium]|nr:hypothetical protein [Nocardioidaceae bacterium]